MFNSYCTCLYRFSLDLIFTLLTIILNSFMNRMYMLLQAAFWSFCTVTLLTTIFNFKMNRFDMVEKVKIFNYFIVTLLAIIFNFIMDWLYMLVQTDLWKIPFHIRCQQCNAIKHISHRTSVPKIQCN